MQRHAHAQVADFIPRFGFDEALCFERRIERRGRRIEGHAKSIADRLEYEPAARLESFAQNGVVLDQSERHGFRKALPTLRAALDVGKDKGNGPDRCRWHGADVQAAEVFREAQNGARCVVQEARALPPEFLWLHRKAGQSRLPKSAPADYTVNGIDSFPGNEPDYPVLWEGTVVSV